MTDLLLVDHDPRTAEALAGLLARRGHVIREASTGEGALAALRARRADVVLLADELADSPAFETLDRIQAKRAADAVVVIVSDDGSAAVEAIRRGASDTVPRPVHPDRVEQALVRIERLRELEREVDELRGALERQRASAGGRAEAPDAAGAASLLVEALGDLPFAEARRTAASRFERRYLEELLETERGNVSAACRRAGIDRGTFYRLASRHGIEPRRFRSEASAATMP